VNALAFALLCLIWSTTWAAIRVSEAGFTPLWAAAIRFAIAFAVLWLISLRDRTRRRRLGWLLPVAGLVNAVSYSLIYVAERRIAGGTAAVLGATNPFFVLAAAAALGYERVTLRKVAGLAIGFSGVVFLFRAGLTTSHATALAMLEVLFAAAILWPTYSVLLRRASDEGFSSAAATRGFLGWTALFLSLGALLVEGRPSLPSALAPWTALLYLALVGSALAWSLFNHLLGVLSLSLLSTMLFIEPAGALGVDRLLGEKTAEPAAWIGAALVLCGVLLTAVGQAKNPFAAAEASNLNRVGRDLGT
jgi:drug/metabolite transporter (DMT)-like permease